MAVKTITIDMEAYERLVGEKREGESFSQTIKRILATRGMTANSLLKTIERVSLAESTLASIERVIRSREDYLAGAPRLDTDK